MNYSLNWLKNKIEQSAKIEYLFFWGHTPKKEGVIDKSCFSQWFPSVFTVDRITYATAEHWMMAKKASLFGDNVTLERIVTAVKPAEAKVLGREVMNFNADLWNASSYDIVVEGNRHKFSQHQRLREFLIGTGDKVIVEASPTDKIWGIGLAQDSKEAANPLQWKGTNLLGFALMEVREILK